MSAEQAWVLFRTVARIVLPFIPIDDLKSFLDHAAAERQEALKAAADELKFGP